MAVSEIRSSPAMRAAWNCRASGQVMASSSRKSRARTRRPAGGSRTLPIRPDRGREGKTSEHNRLGTASFARVRITPPVRSGATPSSDPVAWSGPVAVGAKRDTRRPLARRHAMGLGLLGDHPPRPGPRRPDDDRVCSGHLHSLLSLVAAERGTGFLDPHWAPVGDRTEEGGYGLSP